MTIQNRLRVVQWSTGNAGQPALRGILRHPDLELVGVHAHSPDKIGRDAAELCDWHAGETGVLATDDVDALLALEPDCVCYTAQGETRPKDTVEELCGILRAGINVVNTSIVSLVYPPFASRKLVEPLEAACRDGSSTIYTSGFDPGWSGDLIPLALAACCERVDALRVYELMDYSTYEDPGFTGVFFGFGRPMDYAAPLLQPGVKLLLAQFAALEIEVQILFEEQPTHLVDGFSAQRADLTEHPLMGEIDQDLAHVEENGLDHRYSS